MWHHGSLHRLGTNRCNSRGVYETYIECTYVVEPASIILVSINIKRYCNFLSYLNIETCQPISSEYIENHLARVTVVCFNHKTLRFPLSTRRYSISLGQGNDNSSL